MFFSVQALLCYMC